MKSLFADSSSYDRILVAIGDHELGDNYRAPNDSKTLSFPQFRKAFTDSLYKDSDGAEICLRRWHHWSSSPYALWDSLRKYVFCSRAYKNVLCFVTVDVFYQISNKEFFDRSEGLGGEGVIPADVAGSHLEWFGNVLKEARKDHRSSISSFRRM